MTMFSFLPGIAAAEEGQPPSLQLLQQQQFPGQNGQITVPPELHDIHGPINLPEPVPYLLYSLIGLATLVLLLALYWWFFRRKKAGPQAILPSVAARDELMRAREMMTAEQALGYMERISEILRRYLESRFGLSTTRQTTREFFRNISGTTKKAPELEDYSGELKSCLERCDMAKFAHQPASVSHLQEMENSVLNFVNQTEQPATINPAGGGR
jgi:hypothetical protein